VGVRLNADLNVWGDDECLYSNSNQICLEPFYLYRCAANLERPGNAGRNG